jgi:Leucine-rich repeat (LRR) protein
LAQLTKITRLDLDYNQIADVSFSAGFTNLKQLNLEGNQIDVSSLAGLKNVGSLNLKKNQITNISPLGRTDKLNYA